MQTFDREWHRAVRCVVLAHMALAKSVESADRKSAQKQRETALAEYRIICGKRLDRESKALA
jgi:hypothetical protein